MIIAGKFNQFNCNRCDDVLRQARGCKEDAPIPVISIGEERFMRCPLSGLRGGVLRALKLYRHYMNGFLPLRGGVMNQPATFLEAMDVIADAIEEVKSEAKEKEDG